MKQRIALGTALLLTLGTAVAGTFLYGHESQGGTTQQVSPTLFTVQEVTPDVIEAWKATSLASDYMPPKVPI
jgi:hypothetical protein